jgi:4-cresol dehydrogenase (hydroxylating)
MITNAAPANQHGAEPLLAELTGVMGDHRVQPAPAARQKYGMDTSGVQRTIAGAVLPRSTDEVVAVVRLANKYRTPIYPISTGRNWGYGSANPATHGCVIVDLSGMDRVVACDAELGIVTLQPGVTQGHLKRYLDENHLAYLVPVHGGGPGCSIIGNALERGYGITPITDHFGAVQALTAVLANGEVYHGALHAAGAALADKLFKWGVGPYLDGLFAQSNFGIVTEATLALAPRPECIEAFFFWVPDDARLEQAVERVRRVLRTLTGVAGSINLMNDRRVLSMTVPYPRERVPPGSIMPPELVQALCRQHAVPAWLGIGALYGRRRVVRAARSAVKELLKPVSSRLFFLSETKDRWLRRFLGLLPRGWGAGLRKALDGARQAQAVFEGRPTEVALRLAYWKSGRPVPAEDINPARDGCGLIWYSPLVPMVAATVRNYADTVRAVCARHGHEPLITLTSLSERCFDSTVPLLFDGNNNRDVQLAHGCYRELLEAGRQAGWLPYRFGVEHMHYIVDPRAPFWRLAAALKQAADPNLILAPGRYTIPNY